MYTVPSVRTSSPANIYGGTWNAITGAVLRGDSRAEVYSGGDTHILIVNEMSSHTHGTQRLWSVAVSQEPGLVQLGRGDLGYGLTYKPAESAGGEGAAHSIQQRSYNTYMWVRIS